VTEPMGKIGRATSASIARCATRKGSYSVSARAPHGDAQAWPPRSLTRLEDFRDLLKKHPRRVTPEEMLRVCIPTPTQAMIVKRQKNVGMPKR